MVYVGSKKRISNEILPIIQSYITKNTELYIEPFVGGANIIENIDFDNKIGYDIDEYLIELLNFCKQNGDKINPLITRKEYEEVRDNKEKYPKWYVGLVGFLCTFGSKFFGGYGLNEKGNEESRICYNRINGFKEEQYKLKNCSFYVSDYKDINISVIKNSVIYCDPPYKGTLNYRKSKNFDYDYFYNWCRTASKNNVVLISEYYMPEDFRCIWSREIQCGISNNIGTKRRTEKLFTII